MTDTMIDDFSDDELAELALAADPDAELDEDAVSLWDVTGSVANTPLPAWYMPAAVGGATRVYGWRKPAVLAIIVSFLLIDAFGLCNTYGVVAFG